MGRGTGNGIRTYHELTRSGLQELLKINRNNDGLTLEEVKQHVPNDIDAVYIHKTLSADTFYIGRIAPRTDDIATNVLQDKYLNLNIGERGPLDLWDRMADTISSVEKNPEIKEKTYYDFMNALDDFKFVPGGRIMHGAGRADITTTLINCYVVAIKGDSIDDIYKSIIDEAMTYKYGGGVGHDLTILRPKGDPIKGTGGKTCGPTGFMELYSVNTNTIAQHGRRGANMQTLCVDHPDIEDFIGIKDGNVNRIKYSNISVLLTHEFMNAVENDSDFDLKWNGKIYQTIKARELWDKIIHHAHSSSEPGLIFWDTMKDYHNIEYASPLVSTNPCGEQPLPDGGCCNLGSINLERMVNENGDFSWEQFEHTIRIATRFLDNVIDYNLDRHALDSQRENAINDRRIGLGILGLADSIVKMGLKYDTKEAIDQTEKIIQFMRDTAYKTSIELAQEKGKFPNFEWQGYSQSKFVKNLSTKTQEEIREKGIRNGTILTVAPTGSGAIIAQVTSGIEPIFQSSYKRKVKQQDEIGEFREYSIIHPTLESLFGKKDFPDYVVTAHDVNPSFRVRMQGVIQRYIDSSISSTINLPEDIDPDTVAQIYMTAYKEKLKGVTVYREGSREGILISDKEGRLEKRIRMTDVEKHPLLKIGYDNKESIFSDKYEIKTGHGPLHISITTDHRGYPVEIFANMGPIGTSQSSTTSLEGLQLSRELQEIPQPDLLRLIRDFGSVKGDQPIGVGESRIDSIEHGFSIIMRYHFESYGLIGRDEHGFLSQLEFKKQVEESQSKNKENSVREKDLNPRHNTHDVCDKCGGRKKMIAGCSSPTCILCGQNACEG